MRTLIRYPLVAVFAFLLSVFLLPAAQAQEADLGVTKTGPDSAAAGSNVTYTIEVTNVGPDAAGNATLNDPLPVGMTFVSRSSSPAGWTCTDPGAGNSGSVNCTNPSLAAGSDDFFTIVAKIGSGAAPGTFFNNTATVSTTTFDPNDENNTSTAVTGVPASAADLSVTKSQDSDQFLPDSDVTYTITVTNKGPDSANNAALNDGLPTPGFGAPPMTFVSLTQNSGPAWTCTTPSPNTNGTVTCTIASVTANTTSVFTLVGHIPSGAPAGASYTNQAKVTSDADNNSENNGSTVTATVVSAAPTLTTQASSATTAGGSISDTATLSGGSSASGTISFSVYGPDDTACGGGAIFSSRGE